MGVGFAKDAESQNKQNRSLKNRAKSIYFKAQNYSVGRKESLHYKNASPEELERVRNIIRKQQRRNRIISLVVGTITLGLLVYFAFFHDFHWKHREVIKNDDGTVEYRWVE